MATRTKRGQFVSGTSGNPRGRPAGSRNQRTIFLHSLLDGDAEAIIRRLVADAKRGKPAALKAATERLLPVRASRDRTAEISSLPECHTAADVLRASADVLERTTRGEITLETAATLLKLLEHQRRAIETADLAARLEQLEASGSAEASAELDRLRRRRDQGDD